ncbi:MAG: 50S ribosomal protein L22 [Myxococcota bacterium]|nr:50S ribosomal protein L22 [Myxococcota bacterium]MDW8363244.1 50S ribosomal protein L22 [Myxococcales bacterium]
MKAIAKGRFQRIATRKARAVLGMVRGRKAAEAVALLRHTPRAAARVIEKVLDSAISNARQADPSVDLDALVITVATADKAPDRHMRRWRPRAHGRASRIVKGMSHITIVVSDEV